jgi:hypothetical protein
MDKKLSYLRSSLLFVDPEGVLLCSQDRIIYEYQVYISKTLNSICHILHFCLILLLQLRAELEAGIKVAKEASQEAELDREQLRSQQRHLDEERRRLEDFERDLTSRARELETLTQMAVATKEEGRRALEEARKSEKQRSEQAADIQRQLTELRNREKRLAQVRYMYSGTDCNLLFVWPFI